MKEVAYLSIAATNGFGTSAKNLQEMIGEFEDVNLTVIPLNTQVQQAALEKEYDILISHIGINSIINEYKKNPIIQTLFAKAKKKICYVLWEADRLPTIAREAYNGNLFDEFIAPSHFVEDLLKEFNRPVHYIPITVDENIVPVTEKSDKFTVLSIGQWSARKCFDIMSVAYATAFAGKDDVRMFFKTGERISSETTEAMVRGNVNKSMITNCPPIYAIDDHLEKADLKKLYEISNVCLHVSLGEGFGMVPLKAMAHGLPVIYTDWSGHKDFCDFSEKNIKVTGHLDLVHSMHANFGYEPEMRWFQPDVYSIVDALRTSYEKWKKNKIVYDKPEILNSFLKKSVNKLAYKMIFNSEEVKLKKIPEKVAIGDMTFTSV